MVFGLNICVLEPSLKWEVASGEGGEKPGELYRVRETDVGDIYECGWSLGKAKCVVWQQGHRQELTQ